MKTMMNLDDTQIVRVSEEEASRLFEEGYRYITKSIWKEKVRDVDKEIHENPLGVGFAQKDIKSNKMSKAQKRHLRKSNK